MVSDSSVSEFGFDPIVAPAILNHHEVDVTPQSPAKFFHRTSTLKFRARPEIQSRALLRRGVSSPTKQSVPRAKVRKMQTFKEAKHQLDSALKVKVKKTAET
jgi:hypothetical protein